jgi:hypothetical protein
VAKNFVYFLLGFESVHTLLKPKYFFFEMFYAQYRLFLSLGFITKRLGFIIIGQRKWNGKEWPINNIVNGKKNYIFS